MVVGFLDVRNITISKKKVSLPSKNSFSAYGLCCQGKTRSECSHGLHIARNEAQGMRGHIPFELVEARIVHKTSSLLARGIGRDKIGDDVCVACRGTRRFSNGDSFKLTLRRYW